ncbi:MAG TPA: Gfo/Idh/MocA family oxidoreductase, partial [Solirubrobacteraceae bacterium]|nr:Gfo/Idh/MocA family oxidoreductase [Solirubrobacteraceae bacterium]
MSQAPTPDVLEAATPTRVAVAGLGYWGPNIARNLAAIPGCELRWLCDESAKARERAARAFAGVRVTGDLSDLLADPQLDAVMLATPVATHAQL